MAKEIKYAFTSEEIHELLGGYWYTVDNSANSEQPFFIADYFVTGPGLVKFPNTCFIAMTKETWLQGSGNSGHYKNIFCDSHVSLVKNYSKADVKDNLSGIIAERPIPELLGILPQLIVDNPYQAIKTLAVVARDKMADNGKIIAVTGAVGKSTTVNMLHCLLSDEADYISNINGHNSRTGVPMWLASVGRFSPEFKQAHDKPNVCTLEIAASALWTRDGGVCKFVRPHVGIITHIALTQWQQGSRNLREVSIAKSKVCNGIVSGGKAVLNRDMPDFDFIKKSVIDYGALPVTYGGNSTCDTYVKNYEFVPPTAGDDMLELVTTVDAVVLGQEISYKIGTIGKPVVWNSLAALTAAKLVGFDAEKIARKFAGFKGNDHTLQLSNCGGVCILDCTLTLEIPSIIAAFDLLKQIKQKQGSRKIVLLSRIVNFGEKAPELHLELTKPITNSGFDKFFFHEPLDEFKYLINTIPSEISGGRYNTAEAVVDAVADYVREGDSVLVMGAARGCDFGKVLESLKEKILLNKLSGKLSSVKTETEENISNVPEQNIIKVNLSPGIVCAVYSDDRGEIIYSKGDITAQEQHGLGVPLLLYRTLKMIHKGYVKYTDDIIVDEYAERESKATNALKLLQQEKVKLLTLFSAVAATGAPDAAITLARHLYQATNIKTLTSLKRTAKEWGLTPQSVVTISGRNFPDKPQQCFSINDMIIVAQKLLCFDAKRVLQLNSVAHQDNFLQSDSVLGSYGRITNFLCFGRNNRSIVAMAEVGGETLYIAALGAQTAFERDAAVINAIYQSMKLGCYQENDNWAVVPDNTVTVCGDTYFGEWYTVNRIKNHIDDPMQRFNYTYEGYAYSLEKMRGLLPATSFNMVNYEAVLTPKYKEDSSVCGYTDFSLGGDPHISPRALKSANINAVLLANNHMLDYGPAGCRQTIDAFRQAGLQTLGAGRNIDEAERPVCLLMGGSGKKVIVFNGYWYMERRHQILKYYAIGDKTGLSCMGDFNESTFWHRIADYRRLYPDAFILLAAHWGYDYSDDRNYLRKLAQKAIDAGVDLIIGSGPHMILGCECIANQQGENKIVLYSIGHFVFNTTGRDFDENNVLPYGIVAKLVCEQGRFFLRLYPIWVDNRNTFWQPCPVNAEQMTLCLEYFPLGISFSDICKDEMGYYVQIPVD